MPPTAPSLDLALDVVSLTAAVCDIESVSGDEGPLADAVEAALAALSHLEVIRDGNTVVARTALGRSERVVIAGHLDTVPLTRHTPNLPTRREGDQLVGRGTVDTYCFYDCEEVDSERNGLRRVAENRPDLLVADFAVLMEPTDGTVEGGCKGTLRAEVRTHGGRIDKEAAQALRSWPGWSPMRRGSSTSRD